jgi:hypothetical protein
VANYVLEVIQSGNLRGKAASDTTPIHQTKTSFSKYVLKSSLKLDRMVLVSNRSFSVK